MNILKRSYPATLTALVLLAAGTGLGSLCDPADNAAYVFSSPGDSRVFVRHSPLNPAATDSTVFRVDWEGFDSVTAVSFSLLLPGLAQTLPCVPGSTDRFCEITVPGAGTDGLAIYNATVEGMKGAAAVSVTPASMSYQVGLPLPDLAADVYPVIPLRVPSVDDGMVKVVLARDPSDAGYVTATALNDIESLLYDQLFVDPIYRWRNNQVGFWYATRDAFTRPYDEGWQSRCGQMPWGLYLFENGSLPDGISSADFDVLGVIHRRGGPVSPTDPAEGPGLSFRDCAGSAVSDAALATFSAHGQRPRTFVHELGHTGFGLGEEYSEDVSTRNVVPGEPPQSMDLECCCCASSGVKTLPGVPNGSTVCLTPGGTGSGLACTSGSGPFGSGLPECTSVWTPDPECLDQPDGGCAPLTSTCLTDLGPEAAADPVASMMANSFTSEAQCNQNLAHALAHPGMEFTQTAPPTVCRQLCGPGTMSACPCVGPTDEVWIVDLDPGPAPSGSAPAGSGDDVMDSDGGKHGWTCELCMDTRYCYLWEVTRGQTPAAALAHCLP